MKRNLLFLMILILNLAWSCPLTLAQDQGGAAGRWEGTVDLQDLKLQMVVTLTQNADSVWAGTITLPSHGIKDLALVNISVKRPVVSFGVSKVAGNPVYEGKLSDEGGSILGELTQSGQTFPFRLERRTLAESSAQQPYGPTPATGHPGQGIEGVWQGTLDAGGVSLRVVLRVKKAADGSFSVLADSPDQGVADLLVNGIAVKTQSVNFVIKRLSVNYAGTLSRDGSEMSGQWEQNGSSLPLIFRRLAPK